MEMRKNPFGAHDKEITYDKTILFYSNPLFDAPIENDKINLLFILSYLAIIIFILILS
jgi:hypothetical protein